MSLYQDFVKFIETQRGITGFFFVVILPSAIIILIANFLFGSVYHVSLEERAKISIYAGNYEKPSMSIFSY